MIIDIFTDVHVSTHLSTDMQHRCNILAVEKYTSKLFQTSHMKGPKSHLQKKGDIEDACFQLLIIASEQNNCFRYSPSCDLNTEIKCHCHHRDHNIGESQTDYEVICYDSGSGQM